MKKLMLAAALAVSVVSVAFAGSGDIVTQADGTTWNIASHDRVTTDGYQIIYDGNPALTTAISAALPTSLTTGATGRGELVDLSAYSHVSLALSWDAADSAKVAFGVLIFNKVSGTWTDNDTPVFVPFTPATTAPPAGADTTAALTKLFITGQAARPTFYLTRNMTAPVAGTYTLSSLVYTPKFVPGASGITLDLDGLCKSWNYVGVVITNANGNTVDSISGTFLVRK